MTNYNEIEHLADDVRNRLENDEKYARERQRGYEEKRERRKYEIIIEVVQNYFGRVIQDIVQQLRQLLSLD